MKFPIVVLIEQQLANETQGESSHVVPAAEVVTETDWPPENSVAENQQSQPEVDQQAKHNTEGGDWEFGGHMIADKRELDETIVDQMDLDDEEYITFVEGRDGRLFKNDDTILEDWGNFAMDELTVNDGHDSNWVYNQMEITSGQLFHDKKHLQNAVKKWSFLEKKPFKVVVSNYPMDLE